MIAYYQKTNHVCRTNGPTGITQPDEYATLEKTFQSTIKPPFSSDERALEVEAALLFGKWPAFL